MWGGHPSISIAGAASLALCLGVLVPPASGGVGQVFETWTTEEDVVLFGKDLPLRPRSARTLLTSSPACQQGGKVPRQQKMMSDSPRLYQCVYDGRVVVNATDVVIQTVRCPHPPRELREELYGKPVTFKGGSLVSSTLASYRRPPPPRPHNTSKPFFLCSCLQLWNRAEFLYEWLEVFTHLHGVQRVFVYDNDSSVDKLRDVVRWLSRGFLIDVFNWPRQKTQMAFNSHCALRAQRVCEWVTFTDIDEMMFIPTDKGGRLDTFLKTVPPEIGGLGFRMRNFHDDACHLRRPLGGIIKNYHCRTDRLGNSKHVLRPEAVHHSLFSTAHYFCYKQPYKFKLLSGRRVGPSLFHYRQQAWESFIKKYQRRAGLGTRKYRIEGGGAAKLDQPSAQFLKLCGKCAQETSGYQNDTRLHDQYLCQRTLRTAGPDCVSPHNAAALIVGTGGIGSGLPGMRLSISRLLKLNNASTENIAVGWEFAVRSSNYPSGAHTWHIPPQNTRFRRAIHHVQHPLRAIAAATTLPAVAWEFIEQATPIAHRALPLVQRALYHWVTWNQLIDMYADERYMVEEIDVAQLCTRARLPCVSSSDTHALLQRHLHHPPGMLPNVTWELLTSIDPLVTDMARQMAADYGYTDVLAAAETRKAEQLAQAFRDSGGEGVGEEGEEGEKDQDLDEYGEEDAEEDNYDDDGDDDDHDDDAQAAATRTVLGSF
eukprot:m.1213 g.1213  ORF g.1213 m.1213 type:complete len:709 (-) comp470_c0_seq2:68-2194(-)